MDSKQQQIMARARDASAIIPQLIGNILEQSEREHPRIQPAAVQAMHAFSAASLKSALVVDSVALTDIVYQFLQRICPPNSVVPKWIKVENKDRLQIELRFPEKFNNNPAGDPVLENKVGMKRKSEIKKEPDNVKRTKDVKDDGSGVGK